MPSGGDITDITCNHPTLGYKAFNAKGSEDSTYDLGGFRTNDDNTSIQANGEAIYAINRMRPSFKVKIGWDMLNNQEMEYLSNVSGGIEEADWTFTNVNGTIYALTGKQVGELNGNGNTSTIDINISGSGQMVII